MIDGDVGHIIGIHAAKPASHCPGSRSFDSVELRRSGIERVPG